MHLNDNHNNNHVIVTFIYIYVEKKSCELFTFSFYSGLFFSSIDPPPFAFVAITVTAESNPLTVE